MKIFDKLYEIERKVHGDPEPQPQNDKSGMVRVGNIGGRILAIPEGDNEGAVYVYDGRPIDDLRRGDTFRVDVVRGDVDMRSIYTGMVCDSREWKETNHCIARNGYAIGYTAKYGSKYLAELVRRGFHVTIKCRYDGTSPDGWPIVVTLLPDKKWFWKHVGTNW